MARSITDEDLRGIAITRTGMAEAVLRDVDLSQARMRGVYLWRADIDGEIEGLTINGVEVKPLILAELDRRHPERAILRATEPEELRAGWAALEAMWAATMERVAALPPGTVDESVDDEWSFAQTLRHLVMATDSWFGLGVRGDPDALHPLGMPFWEWHDEAVAAGLAVDTTPPFEDVLAVRADRVAQIRDYLATVTPEELAVENDGPPWCSSPVTALDCIRIIGGEEWEHHRFAVRDLDILTAPPAD
ncbi:DinB family protein [Aquihabitans sp. G128]|uniref:DinB family protein n=1 Tax=Aquihabitans sp. G128 TaxID=2849779 RepID=UPI001C222986|nr:DinB family protein [Aquihabitans sp. G128]QXC59366.1 DinB family protein [Aquihabitans sp. G128]